MEFVGVFSVCAAQPAIVTMEPMSKLAARVPPIFLGFIRPPDYSRTALRILKYNAVVKRIKLR